MLGPELLVDVPAALWNAGPARERATPAGDRPKERRAPSLGLEGTNPRTGRRFFFFLKKKKQEAAQRLNQTA